MQQQGRISLRNGSTLASDFISGSMVSWRSSILSNIEPVSRSHTGSRIATRGQSGHKQIHLISVDLLVFAEQETRNQGSAGLVIEAGVKSSLLGNKTIGFACAIRAANTNCPYRDSTEVTRYPLLLWYLCALKLLNNFYTLYGRYSQH